jgi:hypothetical protein
VRFWRRLSVANSWIAGLNMLRINDVTPTSARDTAHDSATATIRPESRPSAGRVRARHATGILPAPHACDARCNTSEVRRASARDQPPSEIAFDLDIRAERSEISRSTTGWERGTYDTVLVL